MNILVSACLLGVNCRYDGTGQLTEPLLSLLNEHTLIPVCPEQLGGLQTPRPPSELKNNLVVTKAGQDVTTAFKKGAEETLKLAQLYHCNLAILKERSPSCGAKQIYDGSFSAHLIKGMGVTASLLMAHGIQVIGESEITNFFNKS
nr:DUF523 domain-containing protein [uncultured Cellulosilyticum sp.]